MGRELVQSECAWTGETRRDDYEKRSSPTGDFIGHRARYAITQWDTKYFYDFWRPVTAINDPANPNYDPGAVWWPALNSAESDQSSPDLHATPAFPSYASGHSTFGAAVTAVLADFFDTDNFTFTVASDSSSETRTYSSFSEAMEENGVSRIYGGLHYSFDNAAAIEMGTDVGNTVFADAFTVPEPPAYACFMAGIIGLIVRRRLPVRQMGLDRTVSGSGAV